MFTKRERRGIAKWGVGGRVMSMNASGLWVLGLSSLPSTADSELEADRPYRLAAAVVIDWLQI